MSIKTEANLNRVIDRPFLRADVFFSAVILILVFLMAARAPMDTDLWWHLRAGENTLASGQITLVDTFSYTRAGAPWTNHSWLAQVLMFWVFRAGGFAGLSALVALTAAASIGFVLPAMDGPMLLKGFILVLVSAVASVVW
ncbi:MAG TPA: hypothetical protein VMT46_08100, partial [Anaerolineaceae bacterium]|nr:hypothetical protein [Anaerolineaceae bacterium]